MIESIEHLGPPPTFTEFCDTFTPDIYIDEDFLEKRRQQTGCTVFVNIPALNQLAYAVNPYGFQRDGDQPLTIAVGESPPNKKGYVHYGRYEKKHNTVHTYSNDSLFNLLGTTPQPYAPQIRLEVELREMHTTLIHELRHAAERNNTRSPLKKRICESAHYGKTLLPVYTGGSAVTALVTSLALEHQPVLQDASQHYATRLLLPVAAGLVVGGKLFERERHRRYLRLPEEVRARTGERAANMLRPAFYFSTED